MNRGRWLWAVALAASAVTLLAGYTAAVERRSQTTEYPSVRIAAAEAEPEAPLQPLQVVVRDDTGVAGILIVTDEDGQQQETTAGAAPAEYVLTLVPGQRYTAANPDGVTASFYLEENASLSNVTGNGWTDGELLHLDTEIRCTLRILRAAGTEGMYTLTGTDYQETKVLYTAEGAGQARAVFSGMLPGTYTLTAADGTVRTVELTKEQPDLALGLD